MPRFGRRKAQMVLDQVRTVDKSRLVKRLGTLPEDYQRRVTDVLLDMFAL